MYYGKMTKKLEELYLEYSKVWKCDPDFYENAEYGEDEYDEYVDDIKKLWNWVLNFQTFIHMMMNFRKH